MLSDKYKWDKDNNDRINIMHNDCRDDVNAETRVELILNNEQKRLPIEAKEVHFSRSWSAKGDEFKMNSKTLLKSEIDNILESCGLSRTNPYNIVPQGFFLIYF